MRVLWRQVIAENAAGSSIFVEGTWAMEAQKDSRSCAGVQFDEG